MEKMISRKDTAELLGISLQTLDAARLKGLITYVQYVENGSVYFTPESIQEYIARCTHKAKPLNHNPSYRRNRQRRR